MVELTSALSTEIFYMENKTVIGFIGAGNMAYALIKGLLNNGFDANQINISDPNKELLQSRESELEVTTY